MIEVLSEKLKDETKTSHQELEKLLVQKIKRIRVAEDYLTLLGYFYSFYAPLEKEIVYQLKDSLPDVQKRRKVALIVDDFAYFGVDLPHVPSLSELPAIDNYLKAIGTLYVIEGSTLGGQIICNMVSRQLEIIPEGGFDFFSGYGKDTHGMWADFKKFLNSNNLTREEEKEVVKAANRTFVLFKTYILRNESCC